MPPKNAEQRRSADPCPVAEPADRSSAAVTAQPEERRDAEHRIPEQEDDEPHVEHVAHEQRIRAHTEAADLTPDLLEEPRYEREERPLVPAEVCRLDVGLERSKHDVGEDQRRQQPHQPFRDVLPYRAPAQCEARAGSRDQEEEAETP